MSTAILSLKVTQINWPDVIEYPQSGVKSKLLLEDKNCRYVLMSLGTSASIAEHTNPRNATVNVLEGQGILTLEDKEIVLELGIFVFIPANARHSLKAMTDLTFLLTLSEMVTDSNHSPNRQG
ncbi:cupin domain-containing protein [Leptolyngbya sp. PCC 6406]|uniref:cupin domain-containing protein n=1 Tax=Leptolyngbya sp. PCC 6406 TaxID=1173264 RepID=UPI0002ABB219|nr:cupin domain-containing protein [Leptolyngbya sp. PCC 6406]